MGGGPEVQLGRQHLAVPGQHRKHDQTGQIGGRDPIVLTSLTRRTFTNGRLDDSLANVANAAKAAARAAGATMLDLNAVSKKYVQAIGQSNADRSNLSRGDRTHFIPHGTQVFGRMVADLIVGWRSSLSNCIRPDAAMSRKIAQGVYA